MTIFPEQQDAEDKIQEWYEDAISGKKGVTLADGVRWLYNQGWYFQPDDGTEVWGPLEQDGNGNLTSKDFEGFLKNLRSADYFHNEIQTADIVDTYIMFQSRSMEGPVLLRYGRPNHESRFWPNNVIMEELGLFKSFDAINKRLIIF